MFEQRRAYWRNLDNAAKMFSAASSPKDTRVFRFYCVLKEPVDSGILQEALNKTIKKYPVFLSVMRKGLFWHYLEKSELRPVVREEYKEPCSCLYVRDKKALLFEAVSYTHLDVYKRQQYTLAIDRQNQKLESFYDAHHPAVLSMIRMAAENAHREGKWIGICGELAADLTLTKTFLEMGIDELSVAPGMILPLRKTVRECE